MAKFLVSIKDLSKCCESFSGKSRWTTSRDYRPQITSCCNRAVRKTHKGRLLITWGPAHKVITWGLWEGGDGSVKLWQMTWCKIPFNLPHHRHYQYIKHVLRKAVYGCKIWSNRAVPHFTAGNKSCFTSPFSRLFLAFFLTFFSPHLSTLTSRTDSCKNQYSLLFKIWRKC